MQWTQSNLLNLVNATVVLIGVPFLMGSLLKLGRKMQILDSLQESTQKIKHNLHVVSNYLIRNHTKFDHSELQSFSPLKLTKKGEKFIEEIGFDTIFSEHKIDFFQFIDGEAPKLKYDVELAATKSIYVLSDKDYMSFLKVFFYNHPDRNLENTASTLGIFIRDQYLDQHPDISR